MSATTPMLCVISTIAVPSRSRRSRQQLEDRGLDRHVERRGRLVGDDHVGLAGDRHRDHRRAASGRPRAGAGSSRRAAPGRAGRPGRAARPPGARASCLADVRGGRGSPRRSASRPCRPGRARSTGSWKTIETWSPRIGRSLRSDMPISSRLGRRRPQHGRAVTVGRARGSRPMTARDVTDLPDPDSPTTATTSPGATSKLTPFDGATRPASVRNVTARSVRDSDRHATCVCVDRRLPTAATSVRRGPRAPAALGVLRSSISSFVGVACRPPRVRSSGLSDVVEALADQRHAEHDQHDRQAREDAGPPDAVGGVGHRLVEVVAPLGRGRRLDAEAQEAQRRRGSGSPRTR